MIFIFPTKTIADVKCPESDKYKDYRSHKSLLADSPAAKISYEEIRVGLDVAAEALRLYKEESINIHCSQGWKITIEPEDKKSLYEKHLVMEKDEYKCQIPLAGLQDFISPKKSGEEFSGLIYAINTGLTEESLIPEIIGRRFLLYRYAKFIDAVSSNEISKRDIVVLKNGFLDMKNKQANKLLDKHSNIKFHNLKEQKQAIEKVSKKLSEDLFEQATIDTKIIKHEGPLVPTIYFINVPQDTVIAQMCLWANRQLKWHLSLNTSSLALDEAEETQGKLKCDLTINPVASEEVILIENELADHVVQYINNIIVMGIKKQFIKDISIDVYFYLIKNWNQPVSENSFDVYIIKTIKGLNKLAEDGSFREILTDDLEKTIKSHKNTITNNHKYLTVKEAAQRLSEDDDLAGYSEFKKEKNNERWLYGKLSKGKINNHGTCRTQVIREGIVRTRNTYLLDEESYKQAKQIILEDERRRALKKFIVENKKITERGANKYIRDNINRGLSLEEITIKVLNK